MKTETAPPQITFRKDYTAPDFLVRHVRLSFALDAKQTIVSAELEIERNSHAKDDAPLILDGEGLELLSIHLDGEKLSEQDYELGNNTLTLTQAPDKFILTTRVAINPEANTALMGLYISNGMFCTQCEAEGFRRITYFPDRPDVLSTYEVRIEADLAQFPVLLANGNPTDSGLLKNGRHFAVWSDPHPKPCYLFALVAGDLAHKQDQFTTQSGRDVTLKIFVQSHNIDKVDYALDALKRSMKWDEEVFGREYDLDIFMIVAVDHFNFGAMENKGLNIFNSSCVLASEKSATDQDFETIESIVAHEYFHNWSGNRVTCRDWFQLCLKEGFTVFRDQEFSADMRNRAVQRIKDVRQLRARQFPEDAGPLAHPVRPDQFITIDNFYTATIYEKGAELVRMLKTLLGPEKFRAATDYYFEKNDGRAATLDDFLDAMAKKGGRDLSQFARWYKDAGTPKVTAIEKWDNGTLTLTLNQTTKPSPGQDEKPPRHIPLKTALIDPQGAISQEQVLHLTEANQSFTFKGLDAKPVISLNRDFSAPIHLAQNLPLEERLHLIRHDNDGFNRWQAAWGFQMDYLRALMGEQDMANKDEAITQYAKALGAILTDNEIDPAFKALMLSRPSLADIARAATNIDPEKIASARESLNLALLKPLRETLLQTRNAHQIDSAYSPAAEQAGKRALANACLGLLMADESDEATRLCVEQAETASNMTDEAAAILLLACSRREERHEVLKTFYNKWQKDTLVINKWFAWQAMGGEIDEIIALTGHQDFDLKNPNKVRSLIGVMAMENLTAFHDSDGTGYGLFFDIIEKLDSLNPQVAARLLGIVENWPRLEPSRQAKLEAYLRQLAERKGLSENLYEMVTRLIG